MIIESSPGNGHAYWLIEHCPLDGFKDAQKMLATALGGDPAVCDLPRVMRLPGLLHTKGSPFLTRIVQINDLPKYTLDQLYESYGNEYSDEPVKKPLGKKASLSTGYPDGQRTRALTEIIGSLIAKGLPDEQILASLIKWNEKNLPPLPLEKLIATLGDIRRCESRKKSAVDVLIDEMNTLCAVTLLGAKCVVVVDEGNDAVFMSPQDYERYFSNKKLPDGRTG
ncbi:DNA-primase RepB domain-containing protein [Endozoicomonas acroporae]|uniref:DNA-primase RepB domain-containing protein n=1 Tax=Endozoicomonas acroporae TaxID=1701104 RepID=UPI0013D337FC|nr:DNA-primase RepB domain-containing protein [Endozoicomonas acroporae]